MRHEKLKGARPTSSECATVTPLRPAIGERLAGMAQNTPSEATAVMRPQISSPSVPSTHSAPNFGHSSRAVAKLGNKTGSNLEPKERKTETQNQDTRRREAADREILHCKVNARAGGDSIRKARSTRRFPRWWT